MIPKDFRLYARPNISIYAKWIEIDTNELALSDAVGEVLSLLEKELKAMGFIVVINE